MIASIHTIIPGRSQKRLPLAHRKPNKNQFFALSLPIPYVSPSKNQFARFVIATMLSLGVFGGTLWPHQELQLAAETKIFVMEEVTFPSEISIPPPTSEPILTPPPVPIINPTPQPQFGFESDALADAGDGIVATGNTIMVPTDSIVAPAPLILPTAPVFINRVPIIIAGVPPEYPVHALDRGLEGTVIALISIDTNGIVNSVSIEKSAGSDFDGAVLKASKQTRFQPLIRNGHKVSARFRRPFEFILE